jgi:hypothetical protein
MVQVKIFESSSIQVLERQMNDFLKDISEDDLIDVELVTYTRENVHPPESFIVLVTYEAESKMDYTSPEELR